MILLAYRSITQLIVLETRIVPFIQATELSLIIHFSTITEDADRSGSQPQSANTENVTQRKVKGRGFSRENSSLYADVDTTLRRTASCKIVHPKQASIANTNYSP